MADLFAFSVKDPEFVNLFPQLFELNHKSGGTMMYDLVHAYKSVYHETPSEADESWTAGDWFCYKDYFGRTAKPVYEFDNANVSVLVRDNKVLSWALWVPTRHPYSFAWSWTTPRPFCPDGHIQVWTDDKWRRRGYATACVVALKKQRPIAEIPNSLKSSVARSLTSC